MTRSRRVQGPSKGLRASSDSRAVAAPECGASHEDLFAQLVEPQPVVIQDTPGAGRGTFAARKLSAGEVVLRAPVDAVCVAPRFRCSTCCHCLALLEPGSCKLCETCNVAGFCCEGCTAAGASVHNLQCATLARLESAKLKKGEDELARMLCSLVASAPTSPESGTASQRWLALSLAMDHPKVTQFQRRQRQRRDAVAAFNVASMGTPLEHRFGAVELEAALAGQPLNAFALVDRLGECRASALSYLASLSNHSCLPNLTRRFEGSWIVFYALHDIEPGSELYHAYVDRSMKGEQRRDAILSTWSFTCQCPRCTGTSSQEVEALDAVCGCVCGDWRPPGTPTDVCWCLAIQSLKSAGGLATGGTSDHQ